MAPRLGYLLPTREQIMAGQPEATTLLALAERAESLGFELDLGRQFPAGAAAA